jgi:hypothetical protein
MLHVPVETRPKVLLDAYRRYRETTARRLFRQRSRQRENGQSASTHDHIVESRRGKFWQKNTVLKTAPARDRSGLPMTAAMRGISTFFGSRLMRLAASGLTKNII